MWIRIDTDIAQHRKTLVLRTSLGRPTPVTVGFLVMLFSRLADNECDGDISEIPAAVIEEWAGWDGEHGKFDAAFRENFVTDGVIDGWEERQGTLMARQRRDRERKRAERAAKVQRKSAGRPKDKVRTSGGNPGATVTVTDTVTTTTKPTTSAAHGAAVSAERVRDPDAPDRRHAPRRRSRAAAVPDAEKPERETWLTPARDAWEGAFGPGSFRAKQAAGLLAPLRRAGLADDEMGRRLAEYVKRKRGGYCTLADFAAHHGEYVPVDRGPALLDGGVLSAYGEEITRPDGMAAPKGWYS